MTGEHDDDLLLAYLDTRAEHDAMLEVHFPVQEAESGRRVAAGEPVTDEIVHELARLAEAEYAAHQAWHQSLGRP
jgi:hypothetical protein